MMIDTGGVWLKRYGYVCAATQLMSNIHIYYQKAPPLFRLKGLSHSITIGNAHYATFVA